MRRTATGDLTRGIVEPDTNGRDRVSDHSDALQSALLTLQRSSGNRAVTGLLHRDAGRPLDAATRADMEAKFGKDLGDVRLHVNSAGAKVALGAGARAVTAGRDIAFGPGFYAPQTEEGKRLMAHELAHVVQQRSPNGRNASPAAAESEARQAGANVLGGAGASVQTSAATGAQADPLSQEEIQQQVAENEAKAQQTTNPQQFDQLFQQRNALLSQFKGPATSSSSAEFPTVAAPAPTRNKIRIDYRADEHAYPGLELEYTARGGYPTAGVTTPGVYKSGHYWLAPHLRAGTDKVVYYIAYNPETERNEYVVGPGQVENFLAHEKLFWVNAASAYPLKGDVPDYKALSARVGLRAASGDFAGAWNAWKASWSSAARNPQFWMEAVPATLGALAAGAAPLASRAGALSSEVESATATVATETSTLESATEAAAPPGAAPQSAAAPVERASAAPPKPAVEPSAPPAPISKPTATAATDTHQLFGEIDQELQSVSEGAGELEGSSPSANEFQSPKPLQTATGPAEIRTPSGAPVRESTGATTRPGEFQSASAQTQRSMNTAIRADVGETATYKAALQRGEIGLQRPAGANVGGADFITAAEGPNGIEIIVNDAKASSIGKFPAPKGPTVKPTWQAEVNDAIKPGRLNLGDAALEGRIRDAAAAGRIRVRQLNVDYSPAGSGTIKGF